MREKQPPKEIIQDIELLLEKGEIPAKEYGNFVKQLKSKEVRNYLDALSSGSKPEQALREAFFSNNSRFAKYLFQDVFPEVNQEGGFLDYLIKAEREEISLEIKPLYDGVFKQEKAGNIFKKIKKLKLKPENHKDQILKYLEGKREYVVLTNLENWYLFSRSYSFDEDCNYFGTTDLFQLLDDYKQVDDFWYYLDKKEDLSIREPLDKKFYESLKNWVGELNEVEFTVSDKRKTELIINLINKFIFIQSLDKFWVIQNNFIAEEWERTEKKWMAKNKIRILQKYIEDVNEYFFELYDTELFKEKKTILKYIDQTEANISLFYEKLKLILGIDYGITSRGWIPGIIQYNFRRIDEDILGKAYETYLAEIRKEQGIYYTPKYITQFIVKKTIGTRFDSLIDSFEKSLNNDNFDQCAEDLDKIFSLKILDPACGSGSFLIKALREIWKKYTRINNLIKKKYDHYGDFNGKLVRSEVIEQKFEKVLRLKKRLSYQNKKELISKIIIRHLFGNDLDNNALEVAKLNIWLEAIKLVPQDFRYDKLPPGTNHILPNLETNLSNGDALVCQPDSKILDVLISNYKEDVDKLIQLRRKYLKNPQNPEIVRDMLKIEDTIKADLDIRLKSYLEKNEVSSDFLEDISLVHWPLDFFHVYFNDDLKKNTGFDIIIGNPPYFTIRGKGMGTLTQTYSYEYLKTAPNWEEFFRSQSDIYYYFILKSLKLLKNSGKFGYIIEDYWIENDYADNLRESLLEKSDIEILIRFGEVKKIFEDADNDTCILIFNKSESKNHQIKYVYCKKNFSVGNLNQNNQKLMEHITENLNKDEYSDDYIDIYWVNQEDLSKEKWILSKVSKKQIIENIERNKSKLGDLCEVGQGVVPGRKKEFRIVSKKESNDGRGYWIEKKEDRIIVKDKRTSKRHEIEKEYLKPLITNSGINKYVLEESKDYLLYTVPLQEGRDEIDNNPGLLGYMEVFKKELKGRYDYDGEKYPWYGYQRIQNIELFEDTDIKILCPYRAEENRFALDERGYYGTTDLYAIVPKSGNLNINFLLGLLNSYLLTFWYMIAGKSKGLVLEFFANPLRKMPICLPSEEEQSDLADLVSKMILHKKLINKYKSLWDKLSVKYRNGKIKLKKLILKDKKAIQDGNFDKTWILDINIFPNSENPLLKKEFSDFKISIENDKLLKIFGIKDKRETFLVEISTHKQEFIEILYLEMKRLLNSRKKVTTIKHIFKKTELPVIKPNIWEKSDNLINYTQKRFFKYLEVQEIDYEEFSLKTSLDRVDELDVLINARVFKLYKLDIEEVESILNSINVLKSVENRIIKKYKEFQ